MLANEEILLEQYKLYSMHKEEFIARNFATNRFYFISFIAVFLLTIFSSNVVFLKLIPASIIFSAIGVLVCILWWMNIDSYNLLIKVKYQHVIEPIEAQLQIKPFTMEREAIEDYRKNKKAFLFSDMQKVLAALGLVLFFALFVCDIVPVVYNLFTN